MLEIDLSEDTIKKLAKTSKARAIYIVDDEGRSIVKIDVNEEGFGSVTTSFTLKQEEDFNNGISKRTE